ncbi:MAG: hypothetical protein ACFFDT_24690, partial [Candidatus Hodarchaeota archaeon]
LGDIYTDGTIICDLPTVISSSNIKPSLFYDSINFFEFHTSGSLNERFQAKKVTFLIWTNAEYSHLEEYMPYINSNSPTGIEYEDILLTRVYQSTRAHESGRIGEQVIVDIYNVEYL